MMPLGYANVGEENTILRIGGSPETKQHLENRKSDDYFRNRRKLNRKCQGQQSGFKQGTCTKSHGLKRKRRG